MNFSAEDIYHSILLRAADEWNVDFANADQDIGSQFDPLVRFMAGGLASELEQVYHTLHDTETRLQTRLARVLLPEYYHLPEPAHALATATPSGEALLLDETMTFQQLTDQEDEAAIAYNFSPLFPARLQPLTVSIIATDAALVDTTRRGGMRKRGKQVQKEETRRILIGFSSQEPITNWEGTNIFFDLKGKSDGSGEKAMLLRGLNGAVVGFGGEQLAAQHGLNTAEDMLEDYLNGNERLRSRVKAYYDRHFLTLKSELHGEAPLAISPRDFLREWFSVTLSDEEVNEQLASLDPELKKPIYFMEIHLGNSVAISGLSSRLQVYFNVFPVVNRSLRGRGSGEHHFLRSSNIKWLHLQPEEDFHSIRCVYLEQPPGNPVFTYKPFADFKEDKKPSYTLRHGGVGRWDAFNAWKRLAYVVTILQDNYAHQELILKAADSLSLEDVHQLLGKKISGTREKREPAKDIYVLLHAGLKARVSVRVEYWTSAGEAANQVPAGTELNCTARVAARIEKKSARLLTTSRGGRAPLNQTQQLDAIKSAVLSRGRIVTREDVKTFCRDFLRGKLKEVRVADGVGTDPRFELGMTRMLDIFLTPASETDGADWEGICHQLRVLLEERSSANVPFRVTLELIS